MSVLQQFINVINLDYIGKQVIPSNFIAKSLRVSTVIWTQLSSVLTMGFKEEVSV